MRRWEGWISTLRLSLALAFLIGVWLSLFARRFSPLWTLIPAGSFIVVVMRHLGLTAQRLRCERLVASYQHGLARIEDRWSGTGRTGEQFADAHHLYANDLDLFGKGGLFSLLSNARTRMGEETLARWLLAPGAVAEILDRQSAIRELRERSDIAEEIAGLELDAEIAVQHDALIAWAEAPAVLIQKWLIPTAAALPILGAAAAVFWAVTGFAWPFWLTLLLAGALLYSVRGTIDRVLKGTEGAFADLRFFSEILLRIEGAQLREPALTTFVSGLSSNSLPASQLVRKLRFIDSLAGSRRNMIVMVAGAVFLYPLQVALAAERWRRRHGGIVRTWIDATGYFEALSSLATYSYEHPADPFPVFIEGAPGFRASSIGHPLIEQSRCVRNDVSLEGAVRLMLVSGSNMSGKSTLLRAIGINVVLAMAGAPVRAQHLQLSALQIGASIRTSDSLQEGSSRFYAEITRLRALLAAADRPPALLFLLDELLQGTNSHDRRIGAQGILKAFVDRGAIGLASTHDLALTALDGLAGGALRNVHFRDELKDGVMTFDFTLRDGVVTKSNGIELMRFVGLLV